MEVEAVIGRLRLREGGELVRGRPVELATIDNHAAGDGPVAGQVFRHGADHQRRSMLNRAAEIASGRGVVDNQGEAGVIGNLRNGVEVCDIAAGIGNRLTEDRARILVDGGLDRVGIIKIDKTG